MKSHLLKIARTINKIVDWGIDLLIALAKQFYYDMRNKKRRAIHLRIILGVFVCFIFMSVYFSTNKKDFVSPVIRHWEDDKVRIEELERKLNEANDKMFELEEFRQGLLQGDKEAVVKYIKMKFGERSQDALAIAECESGFNAKAVGDKSIAYWEDGELRGQSYGVFQIRYLKGRPPVDKLHDAKFNIDWAYTASRGGEDFTGAWVNCSKKAGLLSYK